MAFWRSAGYNGNHHINDEDCMCNACQNERRLILQEAEEAGLLGEQHRHYQPSRLQNRNFQPMGDIGFIDANTSSYSVLGAGYRTCVYKTFAQSAAGRMSIQDKQIRIGDDKNFICEKIQRRVGEILSRLNYLASKNGLDFYEFKASIKHDLENEIELETEIKVFEQAEAEAAMAKHAEEVYEHFHNLAEQRLMEGRPVPAVMRPQTRGPVFIPDADRQEENPIFNFGIEDVAPICPVEYVQSQARNHVNRGGWPLPFNQDQARCGSSKQRDIDEEHSSSTPTSAKKCEEQEVLRSSTEDSDSGQDHDTPPKGNIWDLPIIRPASSDSCTSNDEDESGMELLPTEDLESICDDEESDTISEDISINISDYVPVPKPKSKPKEMPPRVQPIPLYRQPRFHETRPGTAETLEFLSNPPEIGDHVEEGDMKEINAYYRRAMQVAQTCEDFNAFADYNLIHHKTGTPAPRTNHW